MAVSITATAGSASANSFVTLLESEAYMETRLNGSTWDDASADDRSRALVEATREMSACAWKGRRSTDTQALSWPRQWVTDFDSSNLTYIDSTIVPQWLKDVTVELAFQFIKAGTSDVASIDQTIGIKRKKVDVLETEYADGPARPQGIRRYPRIWNRVAPYIESAKGQLNLVRG